VLFYQALKTFNGVVLETVSKITLEDLAADPRQLEVMESPMSCSELLVPDLQPSSLSHPGQSTLHDPADFPQSTAVRCPRLGQVVLDPSLPQAFAIARGPVSSVPVQAAGSTMPAAARLADQRDVIEQGQGHQRIVPLRA